MDLKILAVVLLVAVLALGGMAFATNFQMDKPMIGKWKKPDSNSTSPPDLSKLMEFHDAVLSSDYETAKSLHDKYGFGGRIFDKLNQTTFAEFSQIKNMQKHLGEELGLPSKDKSGEDPDFSPRGHGCMHRGGDFQR